MEPEPTCIRGERDAQRLHPDDSPRPRSGTRSCLERRAVHAEDCQTSSRELRECRDRRGHARWPCRKRPRSSAAPRYHSTVIRRCSSAAADGQPSQTLRPSRRARRRAGVLFYLPKDHGAARAGRSARGPCFAHGPNPGRLSGPTQKVRQCSTTFRDEVSFFYFRYPLHPPGDLCGQWRASPSSGGLGARGNAHAQPSAIPRRGKGVKYRLVHTLTHMDHGARIVYKQQ